MIFDDILCKIGEFGIYQVVLYILLGLVGIPTGWQHWALTFVGGEEDHWCHIQRLENFSLATQLYVGVPREGDRYSRCYMYDYNYDALTDDDIRTWNRSARVTNETGTIPCQQWRFASRLYKSTIQTEMILVCGNRYKLEQVQSIYLGGFLAGSVLFGAFADRFGRHKTLVLTLFLELALGITTALMTQYEVWAITRFLTGTAVAGSFNTAFVMVMEMIGQSRRMGAGIFLQGWFAIGIMILAGIGNSVRSHQKLQFMITFPVTFLLIYYWIVPESPRWFAVMGRFHDAEKVLRRMAEVNGRELPEELHLDENVKAEEPAEEDRQRLDESYHKKAGEQPLNRRAYFFDLVRTPNMRKKFISLMVVWFANDFITVGFSKNVGMVANNQFLTTFLFGAVQIPAYLTCVLIMDRVGRRWPLVVSLCIGSLLALMCIPFLHNPALKGPLHGFSYLGVLVLATTYATLYVYTAEVLPTAVRSVGVGLGAAMARVGSLLAIRFAEDVENVWPPVPMILCAAFAIIGAFMAFSLPETLDHKLPETVMEGERFGKDCLKKFFETGEIHESFRVEKERYSQCNWNPVFPLAVHMGNFNNIMEHHEKSSMANNSPASGHKKGRRKRSMAPLDEC